jgi:serine/threonine protein kinase
MDGLTPGTPIYMSPEQATGKNIAGPCDIYSLGVIAYEALVGAPPFDGRTLAEVVCLHLAGEAAPLRERTTAPVELCALVHRMLNKDPATRPGAIEVRQVARAVAHSLTHAPEYHAYELDTHEHATLAAPVWTGETHVVDPDALELGVTMELLVPRKPRWTPEIGFAHSAAHQPLPDRGERAHAHGGGNAGVADAHGDAAAYDLNHKNSRRSP